MKKSILMAALGLLSLNTIAQDTLKEEGFIFTTVKENPITSVKNQNRAGTCWCYSGLAFIESELLRMGKGEYDFSEMFIVHNTYLDRADKAVRTHGDVSFSQGGSFYDVIYGMKTFGLVPEEEMRPGVLRLVILGHVGRRHEQHGPGHQAQLRDRSGAAARHDQVGRRIGVVHAVDESSLPDIPRRVRRQKSLHLALVVFPRLPDYLHRSVGCDFLT